MPSEKLKALQQAIHDRTLTNTSDSKFVPAAWLPGILGEKQILEVLDEGSIDKDERPGIARTVHKGGLKVFAVLVLMGKPDLIYNFCQSNQYASVDSLDSRFHMNKSGLADALGLTKAQRKREIYMADPKTVKAGPDPKLEQLKLQEENCARLCDDFESTQYLFLSPTFPQGPLHCEINSLIPLPFLHQDRKIDSGSGYFGAVYKEILPSERYSSGKDNTGTTVVRKELRSKGEGAYAQELRCLRLLRATRHPNLLELYGSYTYEWKHNFVFPEAIGGDLHQLLAKEIRPPELSQDKDFYLAFCGLASALEQLHCYSNDDLHLEMIGCHHDLKPQNVLVDRGRFILADFGLSSMRERNEDPRTRARDRDLYFCAPENYNYATWSKQMVGPSSDIWSLGCILAEVLTYIQGGPEAVRNFGERRRLDVKFGKCLMKMKAFHNGKGGMNPGVICHLDEMVEAVRKKADQSVQSVAGTVTPEENLVQLVRDMLIIDASERLDIKEVLRRLRIITLRKTAEPVSEMFQASPYAKNLEFFVERQVFLEWLGKLSEATQMQDRKSLKVFFPTDAAFLETYETLGKLGEAVNLLAQEAAAITDLDAVPPPLFSPLRRLNEQLLTCLDEASRRSLRRMVELGVMPTALELTRQSDVRSVTASKAGELLASGPNVNLLRLLAAEQVSRRMQASNSSVPQIQLDDIVPLQPQLPNTAKQATFAIGTLVAKGDAQVETPIVIELLSIGPEYSSPKKSEQLTKRLENILSLGHQTDTLREFRALNCAGYYLDADAIGLVYNYPEASIGQYKERPEVTTLAETLLKWPNITDVKRHTVVTVDDRLRLAYDLAMAIFGFHKIRWLHKNISPYNILFFRASPKSNTKEGGHSVVPYQVDLSSPALIGFSHSRQTDEDKFSSKIYSTDDFMRVYHHPDYAEANAGVQNAYRPEYDYYSLGLVLLEIGFWRPVRLMYNKSYDRKALRKKLLENFVPLLAGTMGKAYTRAVEACLSGALCEKGGTMVDENFSKIVIASLEERLN